MSTMLHFQCEQTSNCPACEKKADTVRLQDELTGALIGLARATEGNEAFVTTAMDDLVAEALFATSNTGFSDAALRALITRVDDAKRTLVPDCYNCGMPCGRNANYSMDALWQTDKQIRSLKCLILLIIRGIAGYAYLALTSGHRDEKITRFLYKALFAMGADWGVDHLQSIVTEAGAACLACMTPVRKAE